MVMKTNARIKTANRDQLLMDVIDYDKLIPENHPARTIAIFLEQLNLESFYEIIKARDGVAGRSAYDPKLLLCIWLYATVEGISSARLIERLCERDCAFRWICGGLTINHHTLSDFRTENGFNLDKLLTNIVCALVTSKIVRLKSIVIDGTKMAASASKKSFKGKQKLHQLKKEIGHRVASLRQELNNDSHSSSKRAEAARIRDVLQREKKIKKALLELPKVEALKKSTAAKEKKGTKVIEAKVSISDPDARMMRFANGNIDAGYNCQVAIDPENYFVLSVNVTNEGNDKNLLKPMLEDIEARYDVSPERVLVDSGYLVHQDIIDLAERENPIVIYSPLPKKKETIKPESLRRRKYREAKYAEPIKAFHRRMANKSAQKYYKRRGRIETINGILHNRMPTGFHLRGKNNVQSELLLHAVAHNIMQCFRLSQIS
jgi:transposase